MENFIVSARKYRPDSFQTVVGQDSITRTLKNSIKSRQLAQAYLFCGPRGVGKTTCARIFAKTINCINLSEDMEACNECESCKSFNQTRSMNIHELDAASNNSVDDIRNLIDQVRIPPQIGNYSVYIIDEVHMLSSAAFNAFLKTLEEPPKHVIFILATTEKHKIIPTILSRCQIFDFNRINIKDISSRLEFVAKNEGVDAELDALHIIAQKADGAMRDALSIFDQIVSFSGKNLTYDSTIENLNVLDYDYYFRITDFLLSGNYVDSLMLFNEIINNGFDGNFFIAGLASHFRDLLMCKDAKTIELLEVGETIKQRYLQDASRCPEQFLLKAVHIANECDFKFKASNNKRLHIELSLLKISEILYPVVDPKLADKSNITKKDYENNVSKQVVTEAKAVADKEVKKVEMGKESPTKSIAEQLIEKNETDKRIEESPISEPNVDSPGLMRTPSIKDFGIKNRKTKLQNEAIESQPDIGEDAFDEVMLQNVWTSFAASIEENEPRLYHILNSSKPQLKNESQLMLKLENQSALNLVKTSSTNLVQFLKKELNNKHINIKFEVETVDVKEQVPYTDEAKFKKLAEDNPALIQLKEQLNLDFK
jgi:DNA polymerase-3 subunit gamma/tau